MKSCVTAARPNGMRDSERARLPWFRERGFGSERVCRRNQFVGALYGHREKSSDPFPGERVRYLAARACLAGRVGDLGSPVPIIESRVTSSANSSSLMPSVPAGRSGMTK